MSDTVDETASRSSTAPASQAAGAAASSDTSAGGGPSTDLSCGETAADAQIRSVSIHVSGDVVMSPMNLGGGIQVVSYGGPTLDLPRVLDVVGYLRDVPAGSDDWPSWADLEAGNVWPADPALAKAHEVLNSTRGIFLVGGQGSGKTVIARSLVHELHKDHAVAHWDFEHTSESLPVTAFELYAEALALAAARGRPPLLVFENVHLNPRAFRDLLAARDRLHQTGSPPALLVATSRATTLQPVIPDERLVDHKLPLAHDDQRADDLLLWWLKTRLGLDEDRRVRALHAVAWRTYRHDLRVLRLALEAFDVERMALPAGAIDDLLRARLVPILDHEEGVDDLLYIVTGLGRFGVATDLNSVAQMLDLKHAVVRRLVHTAHRAGLVSVDESGIYCRCWHDSLAAGYWRILAREGQRWADAARRRFAVAGVTSTRIPHGRRI